MAQLDFDRIAELSGNDPLGPRFETVPEQVGQIELGEPGLGGGFKGLDARLSIGLSNTLEEKIAAFKQVFPEGDLRMVSEGQLVTERKPGGKLVPGATPEEAREALLEEAPVTRFSSAFVFREDPSQPFKRVDAGVIEKFEPVGDLIDFIAEDLGAITGEVIAAARTKGGSFLMFMGRLALGAAIGETAQQSLQTLAGVQRESPGEIAARVGQQAVLGGIGAGFGRPADVSLRVARGGGILKLSPERREALRAFERLGLEQPLPGQISDNPFIVRLQTQSSATFPTIARFTEEKQVKPVVEVLKGLRDPAAKSNFLASLAREQDKLEQTALTVLKRRGTKAKARPTGEALQRGAKTLDKASNTKINDAYALARSIEEPSFNLSDLKLEANTVSRGTPVQMQKLGDVPSKQTLEELGLDDMTISRLVEGIDETARIQSAEAVDPALLRITKQIKDADPSLPAMPLPDGKVATATDQLRAWRSELFELAQPRIDEAGRVRRGNAFASRLRKAIDETLDSPVSTDRDFLSAWSTANSMARKRFKRLELSTARRVAISDKPAELARSFAKPFKEDELTQLRSVVSNDAFKQLQTFFKNDLINDPKNMLKRLDAFDKPTLNLLMDQADQKAFREVAEQFTQFERLGLKNIVTRRGDTDAALREVLSTSTNEADRKLFVRTVRKAGEDSSTFRSVQAALIDHVWKSTRKVKDNVQFVDTDALKKVLADLQDKGMMPLLGKDRRAVLNDLRKVADFLPRKDVDFGSSLLAAEVISEARRKMFKPTEFLYGPVLRMINLFGLGRLFTSPKTRQIMIGKAAGVPDNRLLSTFSAALTTIGLDLNVEGAIDEVSSLMESEQPSTENLDFDSIAEQTGG